MLCLQANKQLSSRIDEISRRLITILKGPARSISSTVCIAEPEEPGPAFFEALPPAGFAGARANSSYSASSLDRMSEQLQVVPVNTVVTLAID